MKQLDANIRIWRMTVQSELLLIKLTKTKRLMFDMVTQENLQRLRLRFACKRLLAKFRLNLLNSQQLCFERRSSQLTCRRLGFNSLN